MAEDSLKNYLITSIMIVVFSVLVFDWVASMGSEYGLTSDEMGIGSFNYTGFSGSSSTFQNTSEGWYSSFAEDKNIFSVIGDIIFNGFWAILKNMYIWIITPFMLLGDIMVNTLEFPPIVAGLIIGGMVISFMFGMWRVIKSGE